MKAVCLTVGNLGGKLLQELIDERRPFFGVSIDPADLLPRRGTYPNDERRVVISLSASGHALRERTKKMLGEFHCYLSVPVDELADLRDRLHRFTVMAGPAAPAGATM